MGLVDDLCVICTCLISTFVQQLAMMLNIESTSTLPINELVVNNFFG